MSVASPKLQLGGHVRAVLAEIGASSALVATDTNFLDLVPSAIAV